MNYNFAQENVRIREKINSSAASLLDEWAEFVDECESGYSWDISEYFNEIRVRDKLEAILQAPELKCYSEHLCLKNKVEVIDERFRQLLQVDCFFPIESPWWRRGVLRYAGDDFSEYCLIGYGFQVQIKRS